MIRVKLWSEEIGAYDLVRMHAHNAFQDVNRETKTYKAEVVNISGDRETVRQYLIFSLDAVRNQIGSNIANLLIENVDLFLDKVDG